MMAQNDLVVVGIDVAKDKVDACIRALSLRQTFSSTAEGRRKLISWLRKHKVTAAVMEASGGYEREWARAMRQNAVEVRIVDPKRVRNFARSAGQLAKNDAIDAEMIAWFAETFGEDSRQAHDAAREKLVQIVNARCALIDLQIKLQNWQAARAGTGAKNAGAAVAAARPRDCRAGSCKRCRDQGDGAFCRARRDHRERAGTCQDHLRRPDRGDAGTGSGEQPGDLRPARRRALR